MGFLRAVLDLFRNRDDDEDAPYSIVLLLRSPLLLTQEALEAAACRAFGVPYDGSEEMYFVMRERVLTVVKAGKFAMRVLEADQPYLGDPAEVAEGFGDERLASAWREHRAWVALDLMNQEVPKKEAYRVLAALAGQLLDVRCAGIFLSKEKQFIIEQDGSAEGYLRRLSS